jgi:serine/tyrosine/threonine adenylyltransferase
MHERPNPLLALPFESSLEGLGPDYWDVVEAARFPLTRLRFRNDDLLAQLGLDPAAVRDQDLEAAYGRFEARTPLLALSYHGFQFGSDNPFLGDGRGFLYGQLRHRRGDLQDLGTKGSGTTPCIDWVSPPAAPSAWWKQARTSGGGTSPLRPAAP